LDQLSIELMVAWDEYCVDENREGFEEECEKAKKSWGSDLHQWREIDIEVDEKELRAKFRTGTLEGTIR
jgi:hypothetical protein